MPRSEINLFIWQLECIKFLAPLCENPNTPLFEKPALFAETPIQAAEKNGYDEIKSFLQSLLKIFIILKFEIVNKS